MMILRVGELMTVLLHNRRWHAAYSIPNAACKGEFSISPNPVRPQ
jgi:hypothetical protein